MLPCNKGVSKNGWSFSVILWMTVVLREREKFLVHKVRVDGLPTEWMLWSLKSKWALFRPRKFKSFWKFDSLCFYASLGEIHTTKVIILKWTVQQFQHDDSVVEPPPLSSFKVFLPLPTETLRPLSIKQSHLLPPFLSP